MNSDITDGYIYIITALLPLVAGMLVFQTNPYHALVLRGILGAVAALVYTVLGAADVALTEALVGTMLAMMLYVIAVRSSLVLRLGILQEQNVEPLLDRLRPLLSNHYLRLEPVSYPNLQALQRALQEKEVHATCVETELQSGADFEQSADPMPAYVTVTRLQRIYDILNGRLPFALHLASVTNMTPAISTNGVPAPEEVHS